VTIGIIDQLSYIAPTEPNSANVIVDQIPYISLTGANSANVIINQIAFISIEAEFSIPITFRPFPCGAFLLTYPYYIQN
jgi:hypothetical protein